MSLKVAPSYQNPLENFGYVRTKPIKTKEFEMVNELAKKVARDLFEVLGAKDDKCQRIEAKGGEWPDNETSLGGWCESALAEQIEVSIKNHLAT